MMFAVATRTVLAMSLSRPWILVLALPDTGSVAPGSVRMVACARGIRATTAQMSAGEVVADLAHGQLRACVADDPDIRPRRQRAARGRSGSLCRVVLSRHALGAGGASLFFFSSRRRHTRYIGDWSSDVCSSDLWPSSSSAARRVLVVDDSTDAADSLAMLLELEGHEVSTAYSAAAALEKAERLQPEIAFIDKIGRASCRERV